MRLAFGIIAVGRDANGGRTIARSCRPGSPALHSRAPDACSCWWWDCKSRTERSACLSNAANVIERHLRKPGIFLAGEERFAFFPQALVRVHAAAVIAEERLGHEAGGLAVLAWPRF